MDKKEAYRVVFYFYEYLALEDRNSLIDIIHSSMQLLQDGSPADSSIGVDWEKALRMTGTGNRESIDQETVYKAALNLVNIFYESNSSKPQELKDLVDRMNQRENRVNEYWMLALSKAKIDEESTMLKLG